MKRTFTIAFAALAVLFFTACQREESVNIDQNRIFSDYEYVYDAGKNKSEVRATFRLDNSTGKKLELTYPSRVDFNGEQMAWRNAMGHYLVSRSGNMNGGTITYVDTENKSYVNEVPAIGFVEVPNGMNNISKNGNFFLPWDGGPVLSGETIKVTIKGGAQSGSKTWTTSVVGATHIVLDQYKLQDLVAGNAELEIRRERISYPESMTMSGGRVTSSYISHKAYVTISE